MVKTSFRDSDEAVEYIETLVEDDYFKSKSDFYRFVRDYTLDQIFESYEPSYDHFEAKVDKLENLDESPLAVAYAQEQLLPGFDFAISMHYILESDREDDQKINDALNLTKQFLEDNYPSAYYLNEIE